VIGLWCRFRPDITSRFRIMKIRTVFTKIKYGDGRTGPSLYAFTSCTLWKEHIIVWILILTNLTFLINSTFCSLCPYMFRTFPNDSYNLTSHIHSVTLIWMIQCWRDRETERNLLTVTAVSIYSMWVPCLLYESL
jgi:hypothetical protein